ncbi:MAG: hypothetical protein ACYCDN_03550 [Schaalia turicensis]
MEPKKKKPLSNEELNRLVEESGWIDGEWHSAAAISPACESYGPPGRYPSMIFLVDETPVSWVDLIRDGKVVAMIA